MSPSGEALGSGSAEQRTTIQECWLDAASQLVSARGGAHIEQARRMYVLTLLARVEWEQSGLAEEFEPAYVAGRLNDLYNQGIDWTVEDRRRRWQEAPVASGPGTWRRYLDTQVYPRVMTAQGVDAPQSHYEILLLLRSGRAKWLNDRPQPGYHRRSA